ncbi:hypothetical protein Zmor_019470 [Zophobas morio]|uniref:Uncharacterized protein n=1 Tax=Zophobas morio TaxID=2755281 RepID=A0AA38M8I1_9CUCU|nr:hypothetical protein Zmor_019470 [Zophobas morio]
MKSIRCSVIIWHPADPQTSFRLLRRISLFFFSVWPGVWQITQQQWNQKPICIFTKLTMRFEGDTYAYIRHGMCAIIVNGVAPLAAGGHVEAPSPAHTWPSPTIAL